MNRPLWLLLAVAAAPLGCSSDTGESSNRCPPVLFHQCNGSAVVSFDAAIPSLPSGGMTLTACRNTSCATGPFDLMNGCPTTQTDDLRASCLYLALKKPQTLKLQVVTTAFAPGDHFTFKLVDSTGATLLDVTRAATYTTTAPEGTCGPECGTATLDPFAPDAG